MNDFTSAIPAAIGWILAIAVFIFVLVIPVLLLNIRRFRREA